LRPTKAALPAIGRWLGQFGLFSLLWLIVIAAVPMAWGWQPHAIISGSMQTAIHVGDIVVVDPGLPKNLKAGQVISYRDPDNRDRVMTHRLVQRNADGTWQTKGDANPTPDSTPLPTANIVGKPRILVPWLGTFAYWLAVGKTGYAIGAGALLVALAALAAPTLFADPTRPDTTPPPPQRPRRGRHAARRRWTRASRPTGDTQQGSGQ
jgi:signal peptidase I